MSNSIIEIFGLKNCDKCRHALNKMTNLGYNMEFIDVRQSPLSLEKIKELIELFGDDLLNKRSTTYRGLLPSEKKLSITELLQKYPTLIKRPVILSYLRNSIGWSKINIKEWTDLSIKSV